MRFRRFGDCVVKKEVLHCSGCTVCTLWRTHTEDFDLEDFDLEDFDLDEPVDLCWGFHVRFFSCLNVDRWGRGEDALDAVLALEGGVQPFLA